MRLNCSELLARALLDCERERDKYDREVTDVETDRRYQQDRARAAERDLAAAREALETLADDRKRLRIDQAQGVSAWIRAFLRSQEAGE